MPTILQGASPLAAPTSIDARASALLADVLQPLPMPAQPPRLSEVVRLLHRGLTVLIEHVEMPSEKFWQLHAQLRDASGVASRFSSSLNLRRDSAGQITSFSAWSTLASATNTALKANQLLVIGLVYAQAYMTAKQVSDSHAARLRRVLELGASCQEDDWLQSEVGALWRDVGYLIEVSPLALPARDLDAFELRVVQRLRAQLQHVNFRRRQTALAPRELSSQQVTAACLALRQRIEAGDLSALIVATATWMGLPLDLCKRVPLKHRDDEILRLDVDRAVTEIDLSCVVPSRAAATEPGCMPAADTLVRPLPLLLAAALKEAVAAHPEATVIGDLLDRRRLVSQHKIELIDGSKFSAAALIESRSRPLIEQGHDLHVLALACMDFTRTHRSKHNYALIDSDELWATCREWSLSLGWGDISPRVQAVGFGSRVTPSDQHVRHVHAWMAEQVMDRHPGKRWSLARLIEFHNTFVIAAATVLSFVLALRARRELPLLASMGHAADSFERIVDKRSTQKPIPPVPITGVARHQLVLVRSHCAAMAARLGRLTTSEMSPAIRSAVAPLERIAQGSPEPALILIGGRSVRAVGSSDWHDWLDLEFSIRPDAGRHFWQDALRREGLTTTDIDAFVRHVVDGRELLVSTSSIALGAWQTRVTQAQNCILRRLGFTAIQGLAKRVRA